MTSNIDERVKRHNGGRERTTKPYAPFVLIYKEGHPDRHIARKREEYWKSGVGKEKLRKLRDGLS